MRPKETSMRTSVFMVAAIAAVLASAHASAQQKRNDRPDLQGLWTNSTATPLQRPAALADKPHFTREEASEWARNGIERLTSVMPKEDRLFASDVDETFLDTQNFKVLDDLRTSLIVDPPSGRIPDELEAAHARTQSRPARNFDDVETLRLDERCLMSTAGGSSNAMAPMVPNPFGGNFYQIVQTPDYLLVYTEWIHDARVIRIGGTHPPATIRKWLGDSIGRWEGQTLVVDTTNFRSDTHWQNSSPDMHVVERFTRIDANTIGYRATIEDPQTWARPWTIDVPFKATNEPIYEMSCHEHNLAVENFMRGARDEERRGVAKE
jgi:hypothetical protein